MITGFNAVATFVALLSAAELVAADHLDVKIASTMRERCHIVRFPQGWKIPVELGKSPNEPGKIFTYEYYDEYEFRVPGLLQTKFLVGGLTRLTELRYTANKYEVDLSNAKAPVLPASDEAWQSATPVSTKQKSAFVLSSLLRPGNQPIEFHGFQFFKTGEIWANENSRVSPDDASLVLQSWTGSTESGGETGFGSCFPFGCRGKFFLDIFNADAGKKLLTIEGTYSGSDIDNLLSTTGWLTERYFIVPLGDHRERCLVCEFGGRGQPGAKP